MSEHETALLNKEQIYDLGTLKNEIECEASKFLCNLYGNVNLTSTLINEIVHNFSTMLNNIKNIITPKVCSIVPRNLREDTETLLDISLSPLVSFNTEFKFRNNLMTKELSTPATKIIPKN